MKHPVLFGSSSLPEDVRMTSSPYRMLHIAEIPVDQI